MWIWRWEYGDIISYTKRLTVCCRLFVTVTSRCWCNGLPQNIILFTYYRLEQFLELFTLVNFVNYTYLFSVNESLDNFIQKCLMGKLYIFHIPYTIYSQDFILTYRLNLHYGKGEVVTHTCKSFSYNVVA